MFINLPYLHQGYPGTFVQLVYINLVGVRNGGIIIILLSTCIGSVTGAVTGIVTCAGTERVLL